MIIVILAADLSSS